MDAAGRSRDRVEDLLTDLEGRYESFPVNQTTVSVPGECYDRAVEQCQRGVARVDVHVHNQQGNVLLVESDEEMTPPGGVFEAAASLESCAENTVRQATGIECRIETIEETTITGVHHETNPEAEPVYWLFVLLTGRRVSGRPGQDGCWNSDPPEQKLFI